MELFPYAVSVVIPVYNAEKNLGRTMDSLFQQTIQRDQVEIILIDDGSTDKSPELCDVYAMEHEHIRVIHQENAGVSAARNAGIRSAQGKYILFLDSDDTISPPSLKRIVEFFDVHYDETDVVTYPLKYHYEDGSESTHWRYQMFLKKTGVYDLIQYPQICQTTINICIKNNRQEDDLFDTSHEMAEDQLFTTKRLAMRGSIGFVKEAQYNYFRTKESSSSVKSKPWFSFYDYLSAYHQILDASVVNPLFYRYCENMLIYNFEWKIKGNNLLPENTGSQAYKKAQQMFSQLINRISTQAIMNFSKIDIAYKFYLLSLRTKNRPFISVDRDTIKILDCTGELNSQKSVQIVINQLQISGSNVYVLAYIKCFEFSFKKDEPKLIAVIENIGQLDVPLFPSRQSCYWTKFETNRFFAFHFSCPIENARKISFKLLFRGYQFPSHFWYTSKLRIHSGIGNSWLVGGSYGIYCKKDALEIYPAASRVIENAKKSFRTKLFQEHRKQWFARNLMSLYSGKRVWLYFDSHDSLDNGYYQFQHDFQKRDGIKRYYIYHADNPELIKGRFTKRQEQALVVFNSVRHKCLMAAAEKVLVAYIGRSTYLPFDPNTYQYYSDLFHYEVIYLQHGVMHAKLPDMYSKEKVWQADKIVASTVFEKENFLMLGYREEDILTCGMPRLDRLSAKTASTKRILFAPSWRVYLVKTVGRAQAPVDAFYRSQYYQRYTAFLNSLELKSFLTENDFYLDVQMHPMFSCYTGSFLKGESERIHMVSAADFSEYQMCITDFSSIMFDFVYLNKPVISFFPDRELFEAGLHSYHDFYYPLEDGFALYCEDEGAVIRALKQLQENHFKVPEKQRERSAALYYSREASHAEALYRALTGGE